MDYIYYRCYRTHVIMIKDTNSSDRALQKDIQTWTLIYRDTDTLTKSFLKAVLVVTDHLLQQREVLLPNISQVFLEDQNQKWLQDIKTVIAERILRRNVYHLIPPSGDTGYKHACLFNYGIVLT